MNEKTLRILEFDKVIEKLENLAASYFGKKLVSNLLPKTDLNVVNEMLSETQDGVDFLIKLGSPSLGGIKDIRQAILRAEMGGILNPRELLDVADTLRVARGLKNYAGIDREISEKNRVCDLINNLMSNRKVEDRIFFSILNEEEINDNASPELASIRRQIASAQVSIKSKLNELVRNPQYVKFMQDSIVTIREDRYVVPVKQEYRSEIHGLVHDSSSSGATIFIEPIAVVETNNKIKQLKIKEKIEIEKILKQLTELVFSMVDSLKLNIELLGKVDFILAKAKLSLDYNCVCPRLNEDGVIVIKKGRHMLLDIKKVVPIDFWIGEGFSTVVITGPNTGGKTVSLKTVGLFALMTQSGLHIPACDGSEMNVFKKIYADIGDEQSIEQSLSTFSSHMKNIVEILKDVDENSLVLFDEIGAGTDPTEGAALAMSVLDHLLETGSTTIATTHYSELKVYAATSKGVENACCEFNIESLKPTYKLLIGVPGKSNAFSISSKLGLSDEIIGKAKNFLTQEEIKFEDMLFAIEKNIQDTQNEKIQAEALRREIENIQSEIQKQKEEIKNRKQKLLREAREEARRILYQAKDESSKIINDIREAEKIKEAAQRNKEIENVRLRLKNQIDTVDESLAEKLIKTVTPQKRYANNPVKNLKVGDTVYVIDLDKTGTVLNLPDKNGEVTVLVGILKIMSHISNLRSAKEKFVNTSRNTGGINKARTISREIDVRGCNLDEAISMVDKYLDDASLASLGNITIIHGKGTGVLREGIQTFLKKNSHVKTFRIGNYGEGESGVTIVELK